VGLLFIAAPLLDPEGHPTQCQAGDQQTGFAQISIFHWLDSFDEGLNLQ
jgi:hypothetical protein